MVGSPSRSAAPWPKAAPSRPPMVSEGAKSPADAPEPMVSAAAIDLGHREREQEAHQRPPPGHPGGARDGRLHRAVAAAEQADPPALLPEPRPHQQDHARREGSHGEAAQGRAEPDGARESSEGARHAAQRRHERDAAQREEHRQPGVERQVPRDEREGGEAAEEGGLAEDRGDHGVGDHAREDGRHERVGLEVVAVQHLDGEQRGAERGAEDRRDAGGHAGHRQDAPLAGSGGEPAANQRAERRADVHGGSLAPAGAAARERGDRGERLDRDHPRADPAAVQVVGLDGRVAAAARALGREPRGEEAAREPAQRREQREQPGTERARCRLAEHRLAGGAEGNVAGEVPEQEPLADLEGGEERGPEDAGEATEDGRMEQGAAEEAQVERGRERRHPCQAGPQRPGGERSSIVRHCHPRDSTRERSSRQQ